MTQPDDNPIASTPTETVTQTPAHTPLDPLQLQQLGISPAQVASSDSKILILVIGMMAFVCGAIVLITHQRASHKVAKIEQALSAKAEQADAANRTLTNLQAHVNELQGVIDSQSRQLKVAQAMIARATSANSPTPIQSVAQSAAHSAGASASQSTGRSQNLSARTPAASAQGKAKVDSSGRAAGQAHSSRSPSNSLRSKSHR